MRIPQLSRRKTTSQATVTKRQCASRWPSGCREFSQAGIGDQVAQDAPISKDRQQEELALRAREVAVAEQRLAHDLKTDKAVSRASSPLVLAVAAAAVAALGNAYVSYQNGLQNRALEEKRAEYARIQTMLEASDPDAAAENLQFLVDVGLVTDLSLRESLEAYLRQRRPGSGAVLAPPPPPRPRPPGVPRISPALAAQIHDGLADLRECPPLPIGIPRTAFSISVPCVAQFLQAAQAEAVFVLNQEPALLAAWLENGTPPGDWRAQVGILEGEQ